MAYHKTLSVHVSWAESMGTTSFYTKMNPHGERGFIVGWNVWKPRYLSVIVE